MTSKKIRILGGIAALILAHPAGARVYKDRTYRFQISLPKGWKQVKTPPGTEVISFVSPANPKTHHPEASLNIVIAKGKISPLETLNSFEKDFLGSIQTKYQNFSLAHEGQEKLGPLESRWMEYGVGEGAEKFDSLTFLLLDQGKVPTAFALTFSALPSKFETLRKRFEDIALTFRTKS